MFTNLCSTDEIQVNFEFRWKSWLHMSFNSCSVMMHLIEPTEEKLEKKLY